MSKKTKAPTAGTVGARTKYDTTPSYTPSISPIKPAVKPDGLLEAALEYAQRGWLIVPLHEALPGGGCTCQDPGCGSPAKHPRVLRKHATTNATTIKGWWRKWPTANVGRYIPPNEIVLDVDGPDGRESLRGKHIPQTVTDKTSRGYHYTYTTPDGVARDATKLLPGIDVRGPGGMVVLPPSLHASGHVYTWCEGLSPDDLKPAPAPLWLLELLYDPGRETTRFVLPETIPDGGRNWTIFRYCCQLRAQGKDADEIIPLALEASRTRCKPPLSDSEVRGRVESACKYPKGTAREGGADADPVRKVLLRLAEGAGRCFRDAHDRRFFCVNGEILPLEKGGPVRAWLVTRYRQETDDLPHAAAVQEVLHGLDAAAWNGPCEEVGLRTAERDGALYFDLADRDRNVVRCTADGWSVIGDGDLPDGLHFLRPRGMSTLPLPDPNGNLVALWQLLPSDAEPGDPDADRILLTAWLLACLHPTGPYPVLCLSGEQGSGKSTVARLLRYLVDPKGQTYRDLLSRPPKDERDLWVAAYNQRVVSYDNLTHLPVELSDALAALATGAAYEGRKLYSDAETAHVPACRPVCMTAIGQVAVRGDLLDRSLQVALPSIPDPTPERDLWAQVEALRPAILGGLLHCTCAALKYRDQVDATGLARMADFHAWLLAVECGAQDAPNLLPWSPGDFTLAYRENRAGAQKIAADSSPLTGYLQAIAEESFEGTAAQLLQALNSDADEKTRERRDWPKNATALSNAVNQLAPALREEGMTVARRKRRGRRIIMLATT